MNKERNSFIVYSIESQEFMKSMGNFCLLTLYVPNKAYETKWVEFYSSSWLSFEDAWEKLEYMIKNLPKNNLHSVDLSKIPIFQDGILLGSIHEVVL